MERSTASWLHPDGFIDGQSEDFDPARLVVEGIVVTLDHRLGRLRFGVDPTNITILSTSAKGRA